MSMPSLTSSFRLLHEIGRGRWSTVYLGECVPGLTPAPAPERLVAVKVLSREVTERSSGPEKVYREPDLYQQLQPTSDLPALYGLFSHSDEEGHRLALVLELFSESVESWRRKAPLARLSMSMTKVVLACTAAGLEELHAANLLHTDVKADNILLGGVDTPEAVLAAAASSSKLAHVPHKFVYHPSLNQLESYTFTLSDLSNALVQGEKSPTGTISSPSLRAPEVILQAEPFTSKVDIWALGCLAFELLTGRWLFKPQEGEDWSFDDDHLAKMLEFMGANKFQGEWLSHASKRDDFLDPSGQLKRIDEIFDNSVERALIHYGVPPSEATPASKWITACLALDPTERPSARDLQGHEWLQGAFMGT